MSKKGIKRTLAMAAGLINYAMTYQDYIWLPVYDDNQCKERLSRRVNQMNQKKILKASQSVKINLNDFK